MENIKIKVVAATTTDKNEIAKITKGSMELDGAHSANICYTKKTYDEILEEPIEKTKQRAEDNKVNLHHSVFGHDELSIYIEGIPKILAMLLNNEHEYNTSEKSARYTIMQPSETEQKLYDKWLEIITREIKRQYPNEPYLTDKLVHKKAMENARYMISVFTRTKMRYTTSYRQFNYLYDFMKKMLAKETDNKLINEIKIYLPELIKAWESTGFTTGDIFDYSNREFSLITDYNDYEEQYGRSYSMNYEATFAAIAEEQRHRTIDLNISLKEEPQFYTPRIIEYDQGLIDAWQEDIHSVSSLYPQGLLLNVNETGKYENFIMKLYLRLCTAAQLEINNLNKIMLEKYIYELKKANNPRDQKVLDALLEVSKGARCTFPGFTCPEQCHFKQGMTLKRKI